MDSSAFTRSFVKAVVGSHPIEKRASLASWLKTLAVFGVPLAVGSYAFGKGITSGQADRAKRDQQEMRNDMTRQAYFGQ